MNCKVCGRENCYEHCPESPGASHKPDPKSVTRADGVDWVVDVWCVYCHCSGSVGIDPNAIQWS